MKEFKEHFFPNSYEEEELHEMNKDPKNLGASLAREFLEDVRRELQKQP